MKCLKSKNHKLFLMIFLVKSVFDKGDRNRENLRNRSMQPILRVCVGLVVVVRKGCTLFRDTKLIIFDLDKEL